MNGKFLTPRKRRRKKKLRTRSQKKSEPHEAAGRMRVIINLLNNKNRIGPIIQDSQCGDQIPIRTNVRKKNKNTKKETRKQNKKH